MVASDPADGAEDVPRRTDYHVQLDRFLAPRSISRASVRVVSGASSAYLTVRFDPVARTLHARSLSGRALEPATRYRLEVDGAVDLAGEVMDPPFRAIFYTSEALGERPATPAVGWDVVAPILTGRCTGDGCHGPGPAALGLDLSSPDAIRATAIGAPSVQLQQGATSGVVPVRGLGAIPIVDVGPGGVGRPDASYLVYKVIGADVIRGDPMPPEEPLSEAQARALSDWVFSGAPTE